jgi:hypothetical protein
MMDKRQTDRVIPTYPLKFVLGDIIGIKRKKYIHVIDFSFLGGGGLKYTCPLNILRMVVSFKC